MDDQSANPTPERVQGGTPLRPETVFRPMKKGAWHAVAHQEYGVVWSHCGIRAIARYCDYPKDDPVYIRDLCPTCARAVKSSIGLAA